MGNFKESFINEEEIPGVIDTETPITTQELHDLIDYIDAVDYDIIADMILDFLDEEYEDDEEEEEDEEEIGEGNEEDYDEEDELDERVATKFTGKKKGVRKFSTTKSKMRQKRKKNKAVLRRGRVKKRIARKKVKIKTKKYQASRAKAIKSGQHTVKVHRGR